MWTLNENLNLINSVDIHQIVENKQNRYVKGDTIKHSRKKKNYIVINI